MSISLLTQLLIYWVTPLALQTNTLIESNSIKKNLAQGIQNIHCIHRISQHHQQSLTNNWPTNVYIYVCLCIGMRVRVAATRAIQNACVRLARAHLRTSNVAAPHKLVVRVRIYANSMHTHICSNTQRAVATCYTNLRQHEHRERCTNSIFICSPKSTKLNAHYHFNMHAKVIENVTVVTDKHNNDDGFIKYPNRLFISCIHQHGCVTLCTTFYWTISNYTRILCDVCLPSSRYFVWACTIRSARTHAHTHSRSKWKV